MKIRSARKRGYFTEFDFEDFLKTEFSSSKEDFKPLTEISCNECSRSDFDLKLEEVAEDSPLSFLIKYKAHHLDKPGKIKESGVQGYALPESAPDVRAFGLRYKREAGEPDYFKSVNVHHYNLYVDADSVEALARQIFTEMGQPDFPHDYAASRAKDYLREAGAVNEEWKKFLELEQKRNWLNYYRRLHLDHYKSTYGELNEGELRRAFKQDPDVLVQRLRDMFSANALSDEQLAAIKRVKSFENIF